MERKEGRQDVDGAPLRLYLDQIPTFLKLLERARTQKLDLIILGSD